MDTDKKFILDINELEQTNFPLDELFELQINYNNVKYEFLIRFSSINKNLVCFGSGAYDPKTLSPPIFNRHTWHIDFEESVIYYNDPTLYTHPELLLGWGVGKNNDWYLSKIADIIHILASKNEINLDNIVFFGSSGGGFTSIILATLLKNSVAVVNNPQTFCKNYWNWNAVFNYMADACFDNLDMDTVLTKYGYKLDIIELFKKEKHIPHITYLVNVKSEEDVINHLFPFINSLTSLSYFNDRINLLLYSAEGGHNGVLEKEETVELIKSHFKNKMQNERSIDTFKYENELLKNENKILKKKLKTKKRKIAEIQPIKGYLKYKIKNIGKRSKKKISANSK